MLIKRPGDVQSSEITDKATFMNRRVFIQTAASVLGLGALAGEATVKAQQSAPHGLKLANIRKGTLSTTETPNAWQQITTYNNFTSLALTRKTPPRPRRA